MTPDRKACAWMIRHELCCSAVTGLEDLCTCGALTRALAGSAAPTLAPGAARENAPAGSSLNPGPVAPVGLRAA